MIIKKTMELGKTKKGKRVTINSKSRETHMQVIGASGRGKSKFIEHMIRQDILNDEGLCLIDPHGYLFDDIVKWCETKHMLGKKKIVLFDPSQDEWTFGFNPLKTDSANLDFHINAMVRACAKVWGGEDPDKTPLLERCSKSIYTVLAEKNCSLLEAEYLLNQEDNTGVKTYLTSNVKDRYIQKEWDGFNAMGPKRFYEEFGSTKNRMMRFLSSPIIRNIIGQTENTIDFRKIMDEGWILLVNLASKDRISRENSRLLGTLLVNDIFIKALGRPEGSRPFYLYIDECGQFINEDIGLILTEGRKFGLHLILAHQTLAQVKKAGEEVYYSVKQGAQTKVIFGGLDPEEAEILAKQVFMGEHDLEEGKKSFNRPTLVGYIKTILESRSEGKSQTTGMGKTGSFGISESQVSSGDGDIVSFSSGSTQSEGVSETESETLSESQTWAEALIPILKDLPTKAYSLEEQIYKATARLVNQATQHAIIKLPNKPARMIKAPTIKPGYTTDERVDEFKNESFKLADFATSRKLIEDHLEQRRLLLEHKAKGSPGTEDDDLDSFRV